jgi:hypothetical protein
VIGNRAKNSPFQPNPIRDIRGGDCHKSLSELPMRPASFVDPPRPTA